MYRLVVSDIDGTLVDKEGKLHPETIAAVRRIQQKGILFTVSTGRNIKKALPIAKALSLTVPFFCIDGILAYDLQQKQIRWGAKLEQSQVEQLIAIGKEEGTFLELNDGFRYYKYLPEKRHEAFDFYNSHTPWGRFKSYLGGVEYVKRPEDLLRHGENAFQVVLAEEKEKAKAVSARVKAAGIGDIEVRDHLWDEFLFINRTGMGKDRSIRVLTEHYGISPEEVVAFGDEKNDLDLLSSAGLGVAMGNAVEDVKACADAIAPTNDENGVAAMLKKLF